MSFACLACRSARRDEALFTTLCLGLRLDASDRQAGFRKGTPSPPVVRSDSPEISFGSNGPILTARTAGLLAPPLMLDEVGRTPG